MKQMWLVGAAASVFLVANAAAYTPTDLQGGTGTQVPSGETNLGTVTLPKPVTADGKPLPAGTYTLRLTPQTAQAAPGLDPNLERWVEFVRNGKVAGRELVSIVPADEVKDTMPGPDMPGKIGRTGSRVEMLKGGEYLRVWIARGGVNYLLHLPPQQGGTAK
jgi:hypothetical protein